MVASLFEGLLGALGGNKECLYVDHRGRVEKHETHHGSLFKPLDIHS